MRNSLLHIQIVFGVLWTFSLLAGSSVKPLVSDDSHIEDQAKSFHLSLLNTYNILLTGKHVSSIIPLDLDISKMRWLALHRTPQGQHELISVEVPRPQSSDDGQVDIAIKHSPFSDKPIFLISGIADHKRRPIKTYYALHDGPAGDIKNFSVGKTDYRLEKHVLNGHTQVIFSNHLLRQKLLDLPCNDNCRVGDLKVKWIGDLDEDGKPDIFIDLTRDAAGIVNDILLLSSKAGPDELVGQASQLLFLGD